MRERSIGCQLSGIVGLAFYVGIGALLHALFHSAIFDWNSAWTYAWLIAWPLVLLLFFLKWVLVIGATIFVTIWLWERLR